MVWAEWWRWLGTAAVLTAAERGAGEQLPGASPGSSGQQGLTGHGGLHSLFPCPGLRGTSSIPTRDAAAAGAGAGAALGVVAARAGFQAPATTVQ